MSNNVCVHVLLPSRLSTIGGIPLPVTCGAMVLSCTRYGVWDTNRLRDTQIIRWGGLHDGLVAEYIVAIVFLLYGLGMGLFQVSAPVLPHSREEHLPCEMAWE